MALYEGGKILQAADNNDYNLQASEATVGTWTNDLPIAAHVDVIVDVGDGTKDLDSAASTLTLNLVKGSQESKIGIAKPTTDLRFWREANNVFVPAGTTLTVKLLSDNSADADVDVTTSFFFSPSFLGPAQVIVDVATDVGNSATTFKTNLTDATDDAYKGRPLYFLENLDGEAGEITAYTGATKIITVAASTFTATPADGAYFLIS